MKTIVKTKSIFDCTGSDLVSNGWFIIEDGKIIEVGSGNTFGQYDDEIDLSDYYVMPGLIDAHIHLGLSHIDRIDPMPVVKQMGESGQRKICKAVMYLRQHLEAGVTTVRSMGEEHFIDFDMKRAVDEGYIVGPRIICSGNIITASHGQGQIGLSVADGVEEVRRAARINLSKGADFIKIFVGGGVVSSETALQAYSYNYDEIRVAVEEASALGKYVASHVHTGSGLDMCIDAGVRCIEHACLATDEQIDKIAKSGCLVTGTFSPALHPMGVHSISEEKKLRLKKAQDRIFEVYTGLYKRGVDMCFGTDGVHGAIAFEAINFEKCGASKAECILAITKKAAESCCIEDKVGTLEVGKYADFIALEKNPLENLENLTSVKHVYKDGKEINI